MDSKKSRRMVRKYIPWDLHMAIVRLQGEEELDYEEACVRASVLIEEGGEKYKKAVNSGANQLYKSRHMVEMNKTMKTRYKKGYEDGLLEGISSGLEEGMEEFLIKYPCAKCGGDLILKPGEKDTISAIEFLKSRGWSHSKCFES